MEEDLDVARLPRPFGLNNTGVICHFNSLLQALASCPAFVGEAVKNRDYLARTPTGRALYNYLRSVQLSAEEEGFVVDPTHSARVLRELVGELRRRRPAFTYGAGMESATEGLVLLLDALEPPPGSAGPDGSTFSDPKPEPSPLAKLLEIRVRDRVWCRTCAAAGRRGEGLEEERPGVVSRRVDTQYHYNFFHYDEAQMVSPEAFAAALLSQVVPLPDYCCELCGTRESSRIYEMRRVPAVLPVLFNQYTRRRRRYFPERFRVRGNDGHYLWFREVAQVEHAGGLSGGHYWARCLRKGGAGALLNDSAVAPGALGPQETVYVVFYHFERREKFEGD